MEIQLNYYSLNSQTGIIPLIINKLEKQKVGYKEFKLKIFFPLDLILKEWVQKLHMLMKRGDNQNYS